MNGIQDKNASGCQGNRLLDEVVTIMKYKKRTIYHAIFIKVFSDGNISYLTVYTDDIMNTTSNDTDFPETRKLFQ